MVHRNLLTSEKLGRVSIYRLSERIPSGFMDIAGDREAPTFEDRFHSALYSIPETARTLRDRFQYVARMLGYRQLCPGLLLSFADLSHDLAAQLPAVEPGWCEFATIRPENTEAAKRMTSRALDQQLLERAGSSSTFDLIEWLPSDRAGRDVGSQRRGDALDRFCQQGPGESEVEADVARADLAAESTFGDGDMGAFIEMLGQSGLETISAHVQPGQVGSLGREVRGIGQVSGDEIGQELAIAFEVGRDLVQPVTGLGVRRSGGENARVRRGA